MRQPAEVAQPTNDVPKNDCWEALVSHLYDLIKLLRVIMNGNFSFLILFLEVSHIQIHLQHFSVVIHAIIMNDLI